MPSESNVTFVSFASHPKGGTVLEYKTEVLTSVVGREKLRVDDLDTVLQQSAAEGWELVSLSLDANLRGQRDGHLLVFKRDTGS